jgi:Tfp pilus assembly protein PilF
LLVAQRALINLYAGDGRYTQALAIAREIQKQRPTEAVGYQFEGDIELQRRNWDNAIAAFRTGLQKAPSTDSAVKLYNGLLAAGRNEEAERFTGSWQKDHPTDTAFRLYLGDRALGESDWAQAEARYREVLRVQPENAMALNNVAWLLLKQGKPGALPLAEKATTLAPNQPALLDTLALALAADNQLPRALELHKKTMERAPDNPSLQLTMARLHLQAGDKKQARIELEALAKLGKSFREQAEVAELLKKV